VARNVDQPMSDTGRPTKRTPETEEAIFAALRKGMTKKAAAASGGITYTTLREWEQAFPEFAEALKAAEADSQQELLKKIWTASDQQWQAAAWMLERRWPQDFARRQALEMSGPDGGPIETASRPAELSDEELRDALRARLTTPSEDGAAAEAAGAPADSRLHALPD
jgi:transposase